MANRSFFYGEGLFETILYRGRTKKLLRHYERLSKSAEYFGIPYPDLETFCDRIEKKVKGKKDIYVKVCLVSYGKPKYYQMPYRSELKVFVYKYTPLQNPVSVCISSIKRHSSDPVIKHKTLNYLTNVLVKREAIQRGFYDGLMLNEKGHITESSSANLLLVRKDSIYTPHIASGILLGTTLKSIMEKVEIKEKEVKPEDVFGADHLFLVNSLIGVLPVMRLEDKIFSVDESLTQCLRSIVEEENK
ncbi:MAG: aminotransferase class IV [Hydrogenobacter thermophilus]|nr:aminotransferase class IV [Hydrogenobacter thermophilus]